MPKWTSFAPMITFPSNLVEALRRFQKLDHLGFDLCQVRHLPYHKQVRKSIVGMDTQPASSGRTGHVHVAEEGTAVRTELLESLRKASPTLRVVTISSGSFLKWTADAMD
ncbi:hypothetical protein EDB85DRAFT_1901013 [Lactarius pseudohatsudake]|nr:hypothetical protein EDB85DRAFT_1901013 [Lactarius pseudohatsudake]